jgi:hypothetical protein
MGVLLEPSRGPEERGSRAWGLVVDDAGVRLALDCALVRRTGTTYRCIGLEEAGLLMRSVFGDRGDPQPLYRQLVDITQALNRGEIAKAERLGLQLPLSKVEPGCAPEWVKAGFDPDEPRAADGKWGSGGAAAGSGAGAAAGLLAPEGAALEGAAAMVAGGALATAAVAGSALFAGLVYPAGNWRVFEGRIPDRPDIAYRFDETFLSLYRVDPDGRQDLIFEGLPDHNLYRDAEGRVVGTYIGDGKFQVDVDKLTRAPVADEAGDPEGQPVGVETDKPLLCPDPVKDTPHGAPELSIRYQEYVTGLRRPLAIWYNGYYFDGCRDPEVVLIDAKAYGYFELLTNKSDGPRLGTARRLYNQARAEVMAAAGRPIEWHIADERSVPLIADVIKAFPQIKVIFHPMPEGWKWPDPTN